MQVVGTRLQEAKIWEGDEVSCESWFDPNKGATAFLLDLLVAEGKLVRRWSEEKKEYAYRARNLSRFPFCRLIDDRLIDERSRR